MCECIEKSNQELAKINRKLSLCIFFDGTPAKCIIATEKIDKQAFSSPNTTLFPSYCPFCGEKQ